MDMAISAAPVSPTPKAASASAETNGAAASAAGSSNFKQTLTSSMKEQGGAASAPPKAEAASAASGNAAASAATAEAGGAELLTADQLIEAIGQLLQALQSEELGDSADPSETADKLQDMLDQLNAMLSLLGGQTIQPLPLTPGRETVELSADVQQALVQLQETIGRGQLGAAQLGNPQQWLGTQIKGLKETFEQLQANIKAVTDEAEPAVETVKTAANGQSAAAGNIQQAEPALAKASALLDQLNRQSVSPQLLQMIAARGGTEEDTDAADPAAAPSDDFVNVLNLQTGSLADAGRSAAAVRQVSIATPVPAQQFAETMADLMVGKFEVKTAAGMSEARLTLTPEHLGQVDVRISVHNGQLTALFVAESSSAKDMLDNQLAQLRANLQSQGLNVEKLEVTQQSVESQLSHQHREGSGRQQSEDGVRIGDQAESDEAAFEAELAQQSVIRDLGYGRSINVKA